VWWYIISRDNWVQGPTLPFPAGGGGAGRLGRKIHYVGGFDPEAECDVDVHLVYDLDEPSAGWQDYTDSSPMPEARNHFGTAVNAGKLYTIGGQHGHDPGCPTIPVPTIDVADVHMYDPITDKWTKLPDFLNSESHMEPSTFALDGKVYVVGGQIQGRKVTCYDPQTNTWTRLNNFELPVPLLAPQARILDQTMFVMVGGSPNTSNPVRDARAKTFTRTPNKTLGFNPPELVINLSDDNNAKVETILFSLADSAYYQLNADRLPSWLTVSKREGIAWESFEEIELYFNAANLAEGSYSFQLVASAPGYVNATLNIKFNVIRNKPLTPLTRWLEAECAEVGSQWARINNDLLASGRAYLVAQNSYSFGNPPEDVPQNQVRFHLQITHPQVGLYNLFARIRASSSAQDSYWVRINEGEWFEWWQSIRVHPNNFAWNQLPIGPVKLSVGKNTIDFAYREAGTQLDKLLITVDATLPQNMGPVSQPCQPLSVMSQALESFGQPGLSRAFPNALNDDKILHLQFSQKVEGALKYKISDPMGTMHYQGAFVLPTAQDETQIDFSRIPLKSGLYYLHLNGEQLKPTVVRISIK
ncbi:MAG: hypothetical protein HC880_16235, partial [Bacteroidia bacterium]|nr:hypothetical protein [Bacteroidia bacterium]